MWPGGNGVRPSKPLAQTRPSPEPEPVDWPYPDDYDPADEEEELDEPDGDEAEDIAVAPVRSELPAVLPTITRDELKWKARYHAHVAGRHTVRIPKYAARSVRWVPRGVVKAVAKFWRWATDEEGRAMMAFDRAAWDSASWRSTKREHDRTVEDRRTKLIFALVCCLPPLLVVWATRPTWLYTAVTALLWLAGWYGAPAGQPIVEHIQPRSPELRLWEPGVIRLAFERAGLSTPPREGQEPVYGDEITFVTNPRKEGAGTSTVIDLPLAKTAETALGKKRQLASGLSVSRMQIEITPGEDSERRIELYIHDRDPYREPAPLTPLLDAAKWDFWEAVPFGVSSRGDPVWVDMLWSNMLIGAMPRVGKSFSARQIACAAALDPYVRLIVFNGRPDGAWSAFEKVAHRYGKGERDDVIDHLIATLEECREDYQRRSEALDSSPEGPLSKVTREMTRDRRLNMPLTLIVVDEFHLYIGSKRQYKGRQTCGQRILELLTYLVKVGGATGFMLILATQKPDTSIAKEITAMRDNMNLSFALAVKTSAAGRTILGEIPPGLNPVQFSRKHRGVGVLIGGQDEAGEVDEVGRVVRTYWCDDPEVDEILGRSAALRAKLGTLSGHAVGDRPDERTPDRLLDHILELAGPDEDRLPSRTVLDRLSAAHEDSYSGWTVDTLRSHLRDAGVKTSHQVHRTNRHGERENLRGIAIDEVKEALARKLSAAGANGQQRPLGKEHTQ